MKYETIIILKITWDNTVTGADPADWKWSDLLDLETSEDVSIVSSETQVKEE